MVCIDKTRQYESVLIKVRRCVYIGCVGRDKRVCW